MKIPLRVFPWAVFYALFALSCVKPVPEEEKKPEETTETTTLEETTLITTETVEETTPSDGTTTNPTGKDGCGAFIGAGVIAAIVTVIGTCAVVKKKEEQ